jgi:hypothetical protein
LKGWGFNLAGTRRKRKQEILDEIKTIELLEETNTLDDEHVLKSKNLKDELFKIMDEE